MARQPRLIEPINHATMEDVARAILKKKKQEEDKTPPAPKKKETPAEKDED